MAKNKTKKIAVAGSLVMEVLYPRITVADMPRVRQAKKKASSEAQKRMNRIYAAQKCKWSLAANYGPGDLVVGLTYDDSHLPKDRAGAEQCIKYFRAKLNKIRKAKHKDPLRIHWNIEHLHGEGRYHHHVVINATYDDYKDIREAWIYGTDIEIEPFSLDERKRAKKKGKGALLEEDSPNGSYEALARYLTKEAPEKLGQRSWSCSRNCYKPEQESFRVEDDTQLQIPKGARVIADETVKNQYCSYRVIEYLAPGWELKRIKPKSSRRK